MELPYFDGVQLGLGDPLDYQDIYYAGLQLKSVYVDVLHSWAFFYSSSSSMVFHRFLVDWVIKRLACCGSSLVVSPAYNFRGGSQPDLLVKGFNIEIETGLKKSLTSLLRRLKSYKDFTYVLVPNASVKQRYINNIKNYPKYSNYFNLSFLHSRLYTLSEFDKSFIC